MESKEIKKISSWEDAVLWLKSQPDQRELINACFYDDPLINAANRYHQSLEWQALKAFLPQSGRVLDVGAGRGIASYAFAKEGWKVDALEPDASSVVGAEAIKSLAKLCSLDINIEQSWGEQLPYPDATFDLVFGRQVLHHAKDLELLCKEAARVVKPNGLLIFIREHVISKPEDLNCFLQSHPLHKLYGGEHAYMLHEYKYAFKLAGIKLEKVLNPLESNINLYPENLNNFKKKIADKLKLPTCFIPNIFLAIYGSRVKTPGRLYSFIGYKNGK